ncbi:MAG TPA: nucleotidyltransferase family protein [Candidatus Excrementavichristensenella intestinipullorum]|nr:nucleotidyltransferase family protein [Candidatus Excrementavichristensenella intestinipullorum]
MKALILAAGYATRLYPLTLNTPKALLPIGKRNMMDFLCEAMLGLPGLDQVVVVTNSRFFGQFQAWAQGARERFQPLDFLVVDDGTHDDASRLGAVGDIQFAIQQAHIQDDLLVAASDNFFTFPLSDFCEEFRRRNRDTLLGGRIADRRELTRFAVATLDPQGRVTSLVEKPQNPASDIAIYALYLYKKDTLPLIGQYLAQGNPPDAPGHFPEWLYTRREVGVYLFQGECVDIGTPESYQAVCRRFG